MVDETRTGVRPWKDPVGFTPEEDPTRVSADKVPERGICLIQLRRNAFYRYSRWELTTEALYQDLSRAVIYLENKAAQRKTSNFFDCYLGLPPERLRFRPRRYWLSADTLSPPKQFNYEERARRLEAAFVRLETRGFSDHITPAARPSTASPVSNPAKRARFAKSVPDVKQAAPEPPVVVTIHAVSGTSPLTRFASASNDSDNRKAVCGKSKDKDASSRGEDPLQPEAHANRAAPDSSHLPIVPGRKIGWRIRK